MRYARLIRGRSYPALDTRTTYQVVRDSEVAGYLWIEGQGVGDAFLNPDRCRVYGRFFEVWEAPEGGSATPGTT
jgi:hypothetical protein